jgi:phage terminase large subunit-like protein
VFDDDEFLAIIYTVDDPDKWQDPIEWAKAKPNLGVSVHLDNLRAACEQAVRKPSEQSNFKTKRLNIWLTGGESWIPVQDWQDCAAPELKLEDFAGEECFIGIDLAENGRRVLFGDGFKDRSKLTTWSAPRGPKVNKNKVIARNCRFKILA